MAQQSNKDRCHSLDKDRYRENKIRNVDIIDIEEVRRPSLSTLIEFACGSSIPLKFNNFVHQWLSDIPDFCAISVQKKS
jgi:hypothetical protein